MDKKEILKSVFEMNYMFDEGKSAVHYPKTVPEAIPFGDGRDLRDVINDVEKKLNVEVRVKKSEGVEVGRFVSLFNGSAYVGEYEKGNKIFSVCGVCTRVEEDVAVVRLTGVADCFAMLVEGYHYFLDEDYFLTTEITDNYVGIAVSDKSVLLKFS